LLLNKCVEEIMYLEWGDVWRILSCGLLLVAISYGDKDFREGLALILTLQVVNTVVHLKGNK
jgi:hypothetical protein